MNKQEMGKMDNDETHQDGCISPIMSFQIRNGLSVSQIQKVDESTNTDQMICNCSCQMIPKLKEKAHKSFMQVIQIQNLYKEEIEQLKEYYEERERNNNKKFKCKEEILTEKYKELEQEIEKIKEAYHRDRQQEAGGIESPFLIDSIDSIVQLPLPDDSYETINNLREFIATPNLQQNRRALEAKLKSTLSELVKKLKNNADLSNADEIVSNEEIDLANSMQTQIVIIFDFVKQMIDNTVSAHEKFNELVSISNELDSRYNKAFGLYESCQKESKFMTEHIKRITQQKLRMEKKCHDLERSMRGLEQTCKSLKRILSEKGLCYQDGLKKESDIVSSQNLRDEELNFSKDSLYSSNTAQRNLEVKKIYPFGGSGEKMLLKSLNFKKKVSTEAKPEK